MGLTLAFALQMRKKDGKKNLSQGRRLDEPQSLSGRVAEDKNMLPLPGIERFFGFAACNLVTIPTALSRLPLIGLAKT
jgi:hypothetical protein